MRVLAADPVSIERAIREPRDEPFRIKAYTVATVPDPTAWTWGLIVVSNETGGATIAFSDGTNWRRVQDRVVVS